ncbi:alpha/beta hydrolase [Streptomyces sp. NBC_00654]|uniref:alpha/beta hydrolase n=1 Tax=Streptomyces sp. NBC_00654 TaxID=2975799 RepID=UPI002257F965|nr:alpha/beta hydrolase [Streptomyces sp. NBC_00654]MCX4963558.1 alpha/beta hydrolase [Streptomyces sp. NBC_00654]
MTTCTRKALLLALSATAVASALATSVTPVAHAGPRASPPSSPPSLVWHGCELPDGTAGAEGQQCAELPVPLDYRNPDGRTLTVAVTRLRSDRPQARRGTLLVIAGGPGGSGVERLARKGEALRAATEGAYDLVSLDPRGVGGSTRAGCGTADADRQLVTLRAWPGADGDITANADRSRRVAEACARNGGEVLRSFSTRNEVRDIDRFRQALGEEKLSAWGSSYGTYVGAVYAQKYPRHTDRWVLDSNGDPDPARVAHGWMRNMAVGAADRFPDFAAWASDPAREQQGLRLAERAEDVQPLVLSLARELDREPRESDVPGLPLTGNRLRQAVQSALFGDGAFAPLAGMIRAALDPQGSPVLTPDLVQVVPDEDAAVMVAVICNDVRWPGSVAGYRREVAADRQRYPLTAGMPANITPCAFWKGAPADRPTRITDEGPSNILMIQSLRDPATPYSGALKMRGALGERARMVTVGQGGHGMYLGGGNACGDRTVSEFLVTGRRPAQDTHCAN